MNERFMTLERKALIAARSRSINIDFKEDRKMPKYTMLTPIGISQSRKLLYSVFSSLEKGSKVMTLK